MTPAAGLDPILNARNTGSRSAHCHYRGVVVDLPEWAWDSVKDLPGLLSTEQVGDFLGLSTRYVARLCHQGHLGFVKRGHRGAGSILIPRQLLAQYLVEHSSEG